MNYDNLVIDVLYGVYSSDGDAAGELKLRGVGYSTIVEK